MPFIRKDGSRVPPASERALTVDPPEPVTSPPEPGGASPPPATRNRPNRDVSAKKQPTGEYEVGYCRPPASGRIKPGEVRNPRGRAGAPGLHQMVLRAMRDRLTVRTATGEKRISRVEAIVMKSVEKALKGDNRAIEQSLARYEMALADLASKVRATNPEDLSATDQAIIEAFLNNSNSDLNSGDPS